MLSQYVYPVWNWLDNYGNVSIWKSCITLLFKCLLEENEIIYIYIESVRIFFVSPLTIFFLSNWLKKENKKIVRICFFLKCCQMEKWTKKIPNKKLTLNLSNLQKIYIFSIQTGKILLHILATMIWLNYLYFKFLVRESSMQVIERDLLSWTESFD